MREAGYGKRAAIVLAGIFWLVVAALGLTLGSFESLRMSGGVEAAAADPECIATGPDGRLLCWTDPTAAVVPTLTPTATSTATSTPLATATAVPPTATVAPAKAIPADGVIRQPGVYSGNRNCPAIDTWASCVWVLVGGVTLRGFAIESSGIGLSMAGVSDVAVRDGAVLSRNSGLAIWNSGQRIRVENVAVKTRPDAVKASFFLIRDTLGGCEPLATKRLRDIEVRDSEFYGGVGDIGWFGLEAKCVQDLRIIGNYFEGGHTLVSLPDSLDVLVEGNTFNMLGAKPYWGVEVAKAHNVTVAGNTFHGDGPGGGDHAVSQNSDPRNTVVRDNTITDVRTVLDTWGSYITVTGNHCERVLRLLEFELAGPYVQRVIAGNIGCGAGQ